MRLYSKWPRVRGDRRLTLPPLSGTYHCTARPGLGWKGLKEALASCPEGGSLRVAAGDYLFGPGDLLNLRSRFVALLVDRSVHVFAGTSLEHQGGSSSGVTAAAAADQWEGIAASAKADVSSCESVAFRSFQAAAQRKGSGRFQMPSRDHDGQQLLQLGRLQLSGTRTWPCVRSRLSTATSRGGSRAAAAHARYASPSCGARIGRSPVQDLDRDRVESDQQLSEQLQGLGPGGPTVDVFLKPDPSIPFAAWGIGDRVLAFTILSTAPRVTFQGLSVASPPGSSERHLTFAAALAGGRPRLQACRLSAPAACGGAALIALGQGSRPSVEGCRLGGGYFTALFTAGARGEIAGCILEGGKEGGLTVSGKATAPLVARNAVRGCAWGLLIASNVAGTWGLGEGNRFEGCQAGEADDRRRSAGAAAAASAMAG